MGVSAPLADHFPPCSSRPSSIIPLLSAPPQRITEKERKGEIEAEGKRETPSKLVGRVECEIETCIAPMCPQNCDYYPVGFFFFFALVIHITPETTQPAHNVHC